MQKVNLNKSFVFYSKNTNVDVREQVSLNIEQADANSTYLGLRSTIGGNKSDILDFLKQKM